MEYASDHLFYYSQTGDERTCRCVSLGPLCRGILEPYQTATHYFRVMVPNDDSLLDRNPWSVETVAWRCCEGEPRYGKQRSCFEVILLPAWEPPTVAGPIEEFAIEEMSGPPDPAKDVMRSYRLIN